MFHTRGIIGRSYWTIVAASGSLHRNVRAYPVGKGRAGTPATSYIISVYGVMSIVPQIVAKNELFWCAASFYPAVWFTVCFYNE